MKSKSRFTRVLLCLSLICLPLSFAPEGQAQYYGPCDEALSNFCHLCSGITSYWRSDTCFFTYCVEVVVIYGDCLQYKYCTGCYGTAPWEQCSETCA